MREAKRMPMKKNLWYYTSILLFALLTIEAGARSFYFKSYEVEDGLSNNNVTCCIQDHYGFVWFGTRDGLNRFDGNKFHIIKNHSMPQGHLISSWITDLAISPSGELWVGTNMGVQKYDYQTDTFSTIPFTYGISCTNLEFDHQGNLWILLAGYSLIKYNERSDLHQQYLYKESDPITAFHVTAQDQVWATTLNGYIVFLDPAGDTFTPLTIRDGDKNLSIENMTTIWASPSDKILLIGTSDNGVKHINIQTGTCRNILPQPKNNPLDTRDIFQVANGEVWIATYNGIYVYQLLTDTIFHIEQDKADPYSLSNNAIKQFHEDRDGGIWICTDNGGVNYLPPYLKFKKAYHIPGRKTIRGDIIHDICADADNHIWIGTEDAGLNKMDIHSHTYTNFMDKDGLSQNCIHGLAVIGNHLWIGTHANGIDVMDIRTEKIVRHYTIAPNPYANKNEIIVYLYKPRKGGLLVATALGVYQYNPDKDLFEPSGQFPDNCRIQTLFEDHRGVIWAGTFNAGLYYFDPNFRKQGEFKLDSMNTNAQRTINHIHEDGKNNLWFATGDGVKMYDRITRKTIRYSTREGLPSNVVYRIEEDRNGLMWISTTNGLAALNPINKEIKVFKREHGIPSNQFNYNSSLKAANGKLYFGTLKGMVSFHPDDIQQFPMQPKVYMTQISYTDPEHTILKQEDITFRKEITLDHDQSTFYIDYTSLSYQAPNLTQYAYRMVGLSPKWLHVVGENRVYFTKLPHGNYTFEVKAANLCGIWNDKPAQFHITILPPWWLSAPAWVVYGIIAATCVIFSVLCITRHNRKKIRQKMLEFENQKEKELYQAKIDFFINIAHEIRTPLTLIQSPLEKVIRDMKLSPTARNYLAIVHKNANRLLELVNQLLDFRKTEIEGYKLNFVHTDIIALIHETCGHFHGTAEQEPLLMTIEENVQSFHAFIDKEACTKILSNLLSNAIKYARSKIVVRFEAKENDPFTIDIMNDGEPIPDDLREKIFEPFFRADSSIHKSGTGLGLPLARSLAEMHEGSLTLEESASNLTLFRLRLPVNQPNSMKLEDEKVELPPMPASGLPFITQDSRPTVLIVEDNAEMLNFIGQEINVCYNVVTAGNGEEALSRLKEYGIQLIISDIMMPLMDGFALLKMIKTNLEFSHIPVILLTAKNTLQSRMEGLELGADAYIEKPFSMDLLLTQIRNLLNNRNSMRTYYINSPIANIKSMAYTKADEKFLKKLNDIIDSHINDVNLDVDMIADLMNLSRPTLYRKINTLSNVTPNELIKISRLKKAAGLILQGDMRIYEIAEAVGFNSQSYFSRAFSKQFNMSPSQYAKENNVDLR